MPEGRNLLTEEAALWRSRADEFFRARRLREAAAAFDEALRRGIDPIEIARDRWMCAMLLGDFEAAWRISDLVLEDRNARGLTCDDRPPHLRWVWNGEPLAG